MSSFKEQLIEILDRVCGESYDIIEESPHTRTNVFKIILHYPEVTISNSQGFSRLIKDIYVTMEVGEYKILEPLSGFRMTYYTDEFQVGYVHSHLRIKSFTYDPQEAYKYASEPTSFCLGHSELAMLMADLRNNMDLLKLEMLLFFIPQFLAWESLEGGPHFRMMNINRVDAPVFYPSHSTITQGTSYIIENLYDLPLVFRDDVEETFFDIDSNNTALYDVLKLVWPTRAYTNGNGEYYTSIPRPNNNDSCAEIIDRIVQLDSFKFRGEVVPLTILPIQQIDTSDYYLEAPKSDIQSSLNSLNLTFKNYFINNEILK
jgi:hypothetical protein